MRRINKTYKGIIVLLVFVVAAGLLMFASSCGIFDKDESRTIPEGILEISYLDVGQGDSTFIIFPNGKTMLIDAGEAEYGEDIEEYITSKDVERIDYLVATHPHADHIGGMAHIIESFEIGDFYMPDCTANTKTFENMLSALVDKEIKPLFAKSGQIICSDESTMCEILSPTEDTYDETNNYSIVIKLVCGEKKFLFMGDSEEYVEERIDADVSCDVIKLGHHGSSTSSSEDFISRANPDYAVISCGEDNSYGHPHDEVLALMEALSIKVYRTDTDGTIVAKSDGRNITFY